MLFPTLVLEWSGMQVFVFAAGSPIGLCQFWLLRRASFVNYRVPNNMSAVYDAFSRNGA